MDTSSGNTLLTKNAPPPVREQQQPGTPLKLARDWNHVIRDTRIPADQDAVTEVVRRRNPTGE